MVKYLFTCFRHNIGGEGVNEVRSLVGHKVNERVENFIYDDLNILFSFVPFIKRVCSNGRNEMIKKKLKSL